MAALLWTKRDLARRLRCSPSKVDRLERAGQLPRRRQLGGSAVWLASEVEAAVAKLIAGPNSARTAAARAARRAA